MTDLQLGLLIVGGAAVVGVFIYNRIVERRERRKLEGSFERETTDILLEAVEPPASRVREPSMPPTSPAPAEPVMPRAAPQPAPAATVAGDVLPDERIDYIVELVCRAPTASAAVLEHWEAISHRFPRRALLAGAPRDGAWRTLRVADLEPSAHIRLALQLASRQGATTEAELIEFRTLCDSIAAKLQAGVAAPEVRHAGEAARALDALCADSDIQLVLHLALPARQGIEGAARDAALSAGLSLQAKGFAKHGGSGETLFSATVGGGRLSLALDVPRCPDLSRAYNAMLMTARELSAALGAGIVDDNGVPLSDAALAGIGKEVERVRSSLEEAGVPAGSPLALRVFA